MKPPVETIRLGKQSRDQLLKIKRYTGLENWNIICRWALCASLNEKTLPPLKKVSFEDGVEMTWKVFAGEQSEFYAALLKISKDRASEANVCLDDSSFLHAHIRRGLGYLASGADSRSIEQFVTRWLGGEFTHETHNACAIQGLQV